ncbi:hypothetical protein M9H77_11537 [Catharanthus roseus]|uniref:Uncharacterized protein n=1 Tax=Catharanthus roseus TaxID=4058 RepID=A0ACC0BEY3_CATRO|nr:hypothetical protein M9H77_11537 [Catharanthus roseus]
MDSKTKDVVEHVRSHTTKFSYMHNPGQNEKASVSLYKEVKREYAHKRMEGEDSDFLKCLNAEYTRLKNETSSYVLEANAKAGLTKPLKYMENDPNGEDENDLDSHVKTELSFKKDDNIVSKKRKYTDAIQHETTSKGINANNHCGSPQQKMCSNFRVQILKILCKPYDKEEHERLMQEITKQKPQHKHRDLLFGGVKFYLSDKMGKPLLDHYLVLKRKIEGAVAANNDLK